MKTLYDAAVRQEIVSRLNRLTPAHQRRWGKMEVGQMLGHVADQLRMAVGDIPTSRPRGPLRFAPVRHLVLRYLPMPRGRAQSPPEGFTTAPTTIHADRVRVLELIDRFAQMPPERLASTNPLFGRMTSQDWAILSARHLDHHLSQFGV